MRHKIFLFIILVFSVLITFQNCTTKINPMILESSSLALQAPMQIPLNHPPTVPVQITFQKTQIVNRDYVKAIILEIFSGQSGPSNQLEANIELWVSQKASQFGLGCDTLSSYSGNDCLGDTSAGNMAQFVDHNSVRESFHIQLCQRILSYDSAVYNVLEKIEKPLQVPNADAVIQVYNLFYRGDDPSDLIVNSLLDLDHSLAVNNEKPIDRWRALILQVCETPGWQIF